MTVKVGTWLGAALGLVVLAGLVALAAWSQPAPVEPYAPATSAGRGTLPAVEAARAASPTPTSLAVTPVAVEAFTPTPTPTPRRGTTPTPAASVAAGVVVIVRLVALQHANPFAVPPVLRDAAGNEYPVSQETLAAARRALPDLVAAGQVEASLAFPDYDYTRAGYDGLVLRLNPGSADPLAPALDIALPAVEGD